MNLYRSFGNLMEAWVAEQRPGSDSNWLENNSEDSAASPSDMGANLRTESVDSGVETASSDTSYLVTSCSVSTDNAEMGALTPSSAFDSPLLSSPLLSSPTPSSPHICLSRAQGGSGSGAGAALHLKVEEALQRTDSKGRRGNTEPSTVDEVLRRRPRSTLQPRHQGSDLVRGQRSQSLGPRRPLSDMCRRPPSVSPDHQTGAEGHGVDEGTGLSPGLCYLEQVCQMLEEIARQQIHSRGLQTDVDALQEQRETQADDSDDTKAFEEDISSRLSVENAEHTSEAQQPGKHGHFRRRSASDTTISTLHLRRVTADCRGQHFSTDDLLEKDEEDHSKQETNKTSKNWKLKIGSLRREGSVLKDTKSQQMQSSERTSTRRRLSQLFRRRRKTMPV